MSWRGKLCETLVSYAPEYLFVQLNCVLSINAGVPLFHDEVKRIFKRDYNGVNFYLMLPAAIFGVNHDEFGRPVRPDSVRSADRVCLLNEVVENSLESALFNHRIENENLRTELLDDPHRRVMPVLTVKRNDNSIVLF